MSSPSSADSSQAKEQLELLHKAAHDLKLYISEQGPSSPILRTLKAELAKIERQIFGTDRRFRKAI